MVIASFMWVIWKTRFVFMGVTGNPFVSCPQLRAISASYTVYKAINHAMNCTHKRKCTPARLFILCRLQNIRQLSKLTFPGEDFHLLTHPACSIYTRMQKKKKGEHVLLPIFYRFISLFSPDLLFSASWVLK